MVRCVTVCCSAAMQKAYVQFIGFIEISCFSKDQPGDTAGISWLLCLCRIESSPADYLDVLRAQPGQKALARFRWSAFGHAMNHDLPQSRGSLTVL